MHSSSRNGANVVWLAVHTTEGIMRARDLLAWTTWPGSSHASSDETGELLTPANGFVPYSLAAWTLRNANPISDNIEQCGWARWTRAEWLARPRLLDATARWLAERSRARGIPLVRLSAADIRAHKPGVIGHGDYSVATGDGTHTDPGPNYPWDVVLAKANAYRNGTPMEDDVSAEEVFNWPVLNEDGKAEKFNESWSRLNRDLRKDLAAKGQALTSLGKANEALVRLVAEQNGLTVDDVRRVVSEEVAKGVAVDVTVQSGS